MKVDKDVKQAQALKAYARVQHIPDFREMFKLQLGIAVLDFKKDYDFLDDSQV